ncbi:hypothetical protein PENNAL_c0126G05349, partial [Penicillium nalgiovense]
MSQEEGFMQQWGCGPSEPNCSILTDPEDSSSNEDLSGYQQFARSEGFPDLVRYNLLALESLSEAERQDVAAKADPTTEATSWSEF